MADAFGQAVADPLRPLRIFAPVMAVLAPLFLLAALGLGLSALSAEPDKIATGKGGSLVLPDGTPRELTVYGATADGSAPLGSGSVDCTLTSQSTARIFTGYQRGSATVDGEALDAVAKVDGPWAGGDTVSCPGLDRLAALAGQRPGARLVMAGLAVLVGLGAVAFAVLGFRSRAAHRARTPR